MEEQADAQEVSLRLTIFSIHLFLYFRPLILGHLESLSCLICTDPAYSHLDAVRAVAFHPNELCLATGGDDNTVKIWRVDVAGLASFA